MTPTPFTPEQFRVLANAYDATARFHGHDLAEDLLRRLGAEFDLGVTEEDIQEIASTSIVP